MAENLEQNNQPANSDRTRNSEMKDAEKKASDNESSMQRLSFYATPEHVCNYLPDQQATTLFADPDAQLNNQMYSQLSVYGFRRSGKYIYRPSCIDCKACVPVRIPLAHFKPGKSQRRVWNKNRDLDIQVVEASYSEEHFSLYKKYMDTRHPEGGMDDVEQDKYMEFLTSDWSDTQFVEYRLQGKLLSVAVIDNLETGLSAVYTFFDPDVASRSLGTLAVLWSASKASEMNLPYLYLGYWIENCQKMNYKKNFHPIEQFQNGIWHKQ